MTPLEIRKLIGGYATGSLTDAERKLLFKAALEDQELFDELAGEQALKELLEEPGARRRLIAALQPARSASRFGVRIWPWAAASVAIAAGVVISLVFFRPPAPKQIARVFPPAPPLVVAPVPSPLPAPPELRITTQTVPPPPKEDQVETKLKSAAAAVPESQSPAAPEPARKPESAPAPFAAPMIAGFRDSSPKALASDARPAGMPFTYTITDEGKLRITALTGGFLSVTAMGGGDEAMTVYLLASDRVIQASTTVEFEIPADARQVTVTLKPRPTPLSQPADAKSVRIPVKPREDK